MHQSHSHSRSPIAGLSLSGARHAPYLPRTPLQAVLMALTSSSYLACALTWYLHNQPQLACLFVAVSLASILADGVRIDADVVRAADRVLGITAFVWSVWLNLRCWRSVCVVTGSSVLAVSFLLFGRHFVVRFGNDPLTGTTSSCPSNHAKLHEGRKAVHHHYWGYLARHGLMWHIGGTFLLVLATVYSHTP